MATSLKALREEFDYYSEGFERIRTQGSTGGPKETAELIAYCRTQADGIASKYSQVRAAALATVKAKSASYTPGQTTVVIGEESFVENEHGEFIRIA
jgi:hypothetical protein